MTEKSSSTSFMKPLAVSISGLLLIFLSCMITLHFSHQFYSGKQCAYPAGKLQFTKEAQWNDNVRLDLPEFRIEVINTADRCYLKPYSQTKVLGLVQEAISDELLEELAGDDAVNFCAGQSTYLLYDIANKEARRSKRQTQKNIIDGEDQGGRGQGLDIPYNQRNPRCMDIVLDCAKGGAVGQTQKCYTWINGVMEMEQTCLKNNQFKIFMRKPKGRILKIMQKQAIICIKRRREGLRC